MAEPDEEGRVAAYFPDDFKQYVDTQLNRCPLVDVDFGVFSGWVFWSREDDHSEHPPNILDLKKKIENVLLKCSLDWFEYPTLIQFWAPTMTMDGRSYLTTQNQPFALSTFDTRIDDDVKGTVKGLCGYRMISKDYKFYMDRESSDEQLGVPGRVFKRGFPECSPNVEYYSIKEYPLRDHALRCQLKLSWAIPAFDPSTNLCVGALEIVSTAPSKGFLLANHYDWRILVTCLKEVGLESSISFGDRHKESFQSVRQSEALDEIKKVLEVVRKDHGEKLDSVQMSQTTKSLRRLEPLQSGGEMTQLDLSNQQSMAALNNESNVASAERSNIDVTCSQEKGKTKRPKRVHITTGVEIEIPLDDILRNSKKSIQVAADNLKVSRSTLKRVCRVYGFPSWPPRKKNMVGSSQPSESSLGVDHQQIPQLSSDQPFSQASTAVVYANPHNTVIQDANIVTVKAKYINDITIKFRLSLSSGLVELQQQIAKRLNLEAGSYYVKYKDEDGDLILIACDQDLQYYISCSTSPGSTTIIVLIVPK